MKLSVKVPLVIVTTVVTLALAFAITMHVVVTDMSQHSARDSAMQQLQVAQRALALTGSLPAGSVLDDPSVPTPLADAARSGQVATYRVDQPPVMWAATTRDGHVLATEVSWSQWKQLSDGIDRALAVSVGILGVLSAMGGLFTARRMSRRLRDAEQAATLIAAGAPDERVGAVVGGHDEITSLALTIDKLQDSMQERLEIEKRVTADIAHDLRTPLTGLVTASQLLDDADPMADVVRGQVNRLWRLTEDLLEVARLDQSEHAIDITETTTLALAAHALEALSPDQASLVTLRGEGGPVDTDVRRVQRVLVNLLGNALAHGGAPVELICDDHAISVCDHGSGFPDELVRQGPQRFRTGSASRGSGHGLGLTIAAGQARVVGAALSFTNPESGGACARLDLRPADDPQPRAIARPPLAATSVQ